MKEVKRIDEYKNQWGDITEIEITFMDGTIVTYKVENNIITRKGNL
jgi:hypothetical protein